MFDYSAQPTVVHFVANIGGGVWSGVKTLAALHRPRWRHLVVGVYKGELRSQIKTERDELFDGSQLVKRPSFPGSYHLLPLDIGRTLAELGVDASADNNVFHFHTGPYTPLVFRLPKRPQRGVWLTSFHGARGNFGDTKNPLKRALHGRCVRQMIRDGFTLAAVSSRSTKDCAKMYRCRADDFDVVYNGVGAEGEPDISQRDMQSPLHVGFVGTISAIKGWRRVVEAVEQLRAGGCDAHCSIAGDGAEFEQLQRLAQTRDWLSPLGHVADPRHILMRSLDVLVLPSDFEGHPQVLLEAISVGVPCVCSDVGGNAETIREGLEGFVLRDPTPQSIAARIADMTETPNRWRKMSASCVERHRALFTAQHMADAWEALYVRGREEQFGAQVSKAQTQIETTGFSNDDHSATKTNNLV